MSGGIPISSKKKKPGKNNDKNKKLSGFTIEFDEPFQEPKIVKPEIKVTHSGDFEFEDLFHSSVSKDLNDLHISESDSNHEDNYSSNSHYPTLSDINNNNDKNNNNDNNSIDKFIPSNTKYGLEDFELLKLVGQGGYGKVYQARHKENNEIYAIKLLRKDLIIKSNTVDGTIAEKDILRKIKHPFIVTLHYAFQNEGRLYLVMDFINGGQLFFHLRNQAMFSEELVKFYIAEVVIAVEFLHNNNIIHRDLKPENILIDKTGHLCLSDFGFAKEIINSNGETTSSTSFCGTREYMAPEMIQGKQYGKSVDWWSVGILMFDLLTGDPPFRAKNEQTLFNKILKDKIRLPKYLTTEASSLIKGLLNRDENSRLGCGIDGALAIKKHPFFKSINWKKLTNLEITPPFKPDVPKGLFDISNFDSNLTNQNVLHSPADPLSNSQESLFKGFSFVRTPELPIHILSGQSPEQQSSL